MALENPIEKWGVAGKCSGDVLICYFTGGCLPSPMEPPFRGLYTQRPTNIGGWSR